MTVFNMNNKWEKAICILLLLGILAVILPVFIGCGYTFLCEDDFSFEGGANDMVELHGSFLGPLIRAGEYYRSTQGTFLFNFLIHYIRAYTRWGLQGFHVVMLFFNVMFVLGLFFLICSITKQQIARLIMLLSAVLSVYQLSGSINNMELFFWYTGIFNFVVGMTMAFVATASSIRSFRATDKKRRMLYLFMGIVFGFLGSGCALQVASPNCSFLLAILILNYRQLREEKILAFPFVSAFAGALINVTAPGNFNLESSLKTPGHETFMDAIRDTFSCYFEEMRAILGDRSFWMIALILFVISIIYTINIRRDGMNTGWMIAIVFGVFLMQYFTIFPVAYGRHIASLSYGRVNATYKIIGRLLYLFLVLCMAQWSTRFLRERMLAVPKAWKTAFVLIMLALSLTGRVRGELRQGFSHMAYLDFKEGLMQSSYVTRSYVLSVLTLLPDGADANITVLQKGRPRTFLGMGLLGDSEAFVNRSAAGLFRLNSVSVEYIYE